MLPPLTQEAILVHETGGSEVLQHQLDYPVPTPQEDQILVKNNVSGINFIDTYFRTGLYPSPKPEILGREAAGVIVALGPKVNDANFKPGDRVVWLGTGGYAEYTAVPVAKVVKIPDGISDEEAVASFMGGLTALALAHETYEVKASDWVLLHAAAGGVGVLMTQVLKSIGAKVIGTVGDAKKMNLVKGLGADHVITYQDSVGKDWTEVVKELTDGQGVDVVYDSVGADTWEGSLDVVKRKGSVVWFGNSSGPVPPLPLNRLSPKCIKVARPTLFGYIATRDEFEHYSNKLFTMLRSGQLKVIIYKVYDLQDVKKAHEDLESRKTTGRLLLRSN